MILNIPDHYQAIILIVTDHIFVYSVFFFSFYGKHSACHLSSPCQTPAYSPSKIPLTNKHAVDQLTLSLKKTYCTSIVMPNTSLECVQKKVHLYIFTFTFFFSITQCRDTYWVESINHRLLTYLPKRIHFSTRTFVMRMNLAVLDWVSVITQMVSLYSLPSFRM